MSRDQLRQLPSITAIAAIVRKRGLASTDERAVALAREVQEGTRQSLMADPSSSLWTVLDRQLDRLGGIISGTRYRPVINATGILIHTNLGRAAVSEETANAMRDAASSAVALEIEPSTGRRGGRMREIAHLLTMLTGAESAFVVNNNAAAILLVLSALTTGRRVAVSRAEAVEIGGSFRIPDVLAQSGAELVEVGTTNRTYAQDYASSGVAPGDALLKVHSSNFTIMGFTATPTIAELRSVADSTGALLIEDLGSGTLVDTVQYGIDHEPTVQESVESSVDVVTFSGDKLLGGPQAGIIVGRKPLVERISAHPLARAVRADKTTLAGIAATLRHYVRGDVEAEIPLYRTLGAQMDELYRRAEAIIADLGARADVVETMNHVGGGALPGQSLPGVAVRVDVGSSNADAFAQQLREAEATPVYGRIDNGCVLLETRTVLPEQDASLRQTVLAALRNV